MELNPLVFGKIAERILKEHELTQEKLAAMISRKTGIPMGRSNISQWITGRTLPSDDKLPVLAEMSGLPLDHLKAIKRALQMQNRGISVDALTNTVNASLSELEEKVVSQLRNGEYFELAQRFLDLARKSA